MEYDRTKFRASEFVVRGYKNEYYVSVRFADDHYLHRNGTVHDVCGAANFFDSRKEAQRCIDEHFNKIKLPNSLFEINI